MIALSLALIPVVTFLGVHFRSISSAGEGERIYYALDAAVEAVMVDLVRGADAVDPSYSPPTINLNDKSPSISIRTPVGVATPLPTQQYFDPGVRSPDLLDRTGDTSYVLHLPNLFPSENGVTSILDVNWAFTIASGGASVEGVRIRLYDNKAGLAPGLNAGCPPGPFLAQANRGFSPEGSFNVRLGQIEITTPGIYTLAFCTSALTGTFTTAPFKPSGGLDDTWIYAISFKDYQITAQSEGASITAYVRQVPGPTEPPAGDWAIDNISWIENTVVIEGWKPSGVQGIVPFDDADGDGLEDAVDPLPNTAMTCASTSPFSCANNGFSDTAAGGVTEGNIASKEPGVTLAVLDETPNPGEGVRVVVTGVGGAEIELPSAGFEVNGSFQSGATYSFSAPAIFVLTKTSSVLLEVDQGTVEVEFAEQGVVVTVEENEAVEISESSLQEVVIATVEGSPVVELAEAGISVALGFQGILKLVQAAPEQPLVLTALAGALIVTVDGEEVTLEEGESLSVGTDTVPPTTSASQSPAANANGWNNTNVTVTLNATDNPGGVGVKEIEFTLAGAQVGGGTVSGEFAAVAISAEGTTVLTFFATDKAGNQESEQTLTVRIDKTPPSPVHGGPFAVDEGGAILLDGAASTDTPSGVQSIAWANDGDGVFDDGDPASFSRPDGPATVPVFLRVIDLADNAAVVDTEVAVNNVPPTVDAGSDEQLFEDDSFLLQGSFNDPGVLDTHVATIDWGDGTSDSGTIAVINAGGPGEPMQGTVSATHIYPDPGIFTVTLTVTDNDGGAGTDTTAVTVVHGFLRFCLFGDRDLDVRRDSDIRCGVGSNGDINIRERSIVRGNVMSVHGEVELKRDSVVEGDIRAARKVELRENSLVQGTIESGADVRLRSGARVEGDVIAAGAVILHESAVVTGAVQENAPVASIPPITLVSFTPVAGGPDIDIDEGESLTLNPGGYGDLEIGDAGTLNVGAGQYAFEEFDARRDAAINFDLSGGPVLIDVAEDLDLKQRVNLSIGSPLGSAADIMFRTKEKTELGEQGQFLGTFLGFGADMNVKKGSGLAGAMYGREVDVREEITVSGAPAMDLFVSLFVVPGPETEAIAAPTPEVQATPTPEPEATPTPVPTATPTPEPVWTTFEDTPSRVKSGGDMTTDGVNLYVLSGGGKKDFWKFDVGAGMWNSLADTPEPVRAGGAITRGGTDLYAFRGGETRDFWRYTFSNGIWEGRANAPENVGWGGALTWDGTDTIYAFRGGNHNGFWKYTISTNTWITLHDAPKKVQRDGALVYVSGIVYALRGDRKKDFWRYNVSTDQWSSLASAPANVEEGGSLAWPGGDFIYALRGDRSKNFWRYSIGENSWESLQETPQRVDDGGALVHLDGDFYALRGDDKDDFWKFTTSP